MPNRRTIFSPKQQIFKSSSRPTLKENPIISPGQLEKAPTKPSGINSRCPRPSRICGAKARRGGAVGNQPTHPSLAREGPRSYQEPLLFNKKDRSFPAQEI